MSPKNKVIEYNDIVKILSKEFPDFKIDEEILDLPYVVAGSFARYLLECYKTKSLDKLKLGLDFVEKLHVHGDNKTKELATMGFLEGIQNVWGNKGVDSELIFNQLGKESKKWWKQLNKFWQAEIKYVGETIDEE